MYENGEEAVSFNLRRPAGVLYVTNHKITIEAGNTQTTIPVGAVRSCTSGGRRLRIVWHDAGRLGVTVWLRDMPAAAAESAIMAAVP